GEMRSGDELFLQDRHLLDRNFYAQVAAGNHDAVTGADDFVEVLDGVQPFYFGDEEGPPANRQGGGTHRFHVIASLHERLAQSIRSVFQCKFQTGAVMVGKGTDAESDSGQVQALLGT